MKSTGSSYKILIGCNLLPAFNIFGIGGSYKQSLQMNIPPTIKKIGKGCSYKQSRKAFQLIIHPTNHGEGSSDGRATVYLHYA